jgi:DNA-binding NarL/FixJ family response regulator
MTVRVAVADDQAIIRDGLTYILTQLPGVDLVGTADDGAQACDLARQQQPDLVLMDLRMPVLDGIEATRVIREEMPNCQILVLTSHADDANEFDELRAGARGYLMKDATGPTIAEAIERVAAGQGFLDPAVQGRLLDTFGQAAPSVVPEPEHDVLTGREADIIRLIADGLTNAEIATHLVISETTVKTHINHAFAKLGVRDRAQAVTWAYRTGLVRP